MKRMHNWQEVVIIKTKSVVNSNDFNPWLDDPSAIRSVSWRSDVCRCFLQTCLHVDLMSRIYTCCVSQKYLCKCINLDTENHVSISVLVGGVLSGVDPLDKNYLDDWMTRCIVRCRHEASAKLHLHKWWTHEWHGRKNSPQTKRMTEWQIFGRNTSYQWTSFVGTSGGPFSICIYVLILAFFLGFSILYYTCLQPLLKLVTGLPMELTKTWGLYRRKLPRKRGHPKKGWFSKWILPQNGRNIQVKDLCGKLPRFFGWLKPKTWAVTKKLR